MMLSRIIYCSAVVLATTAVILLALFSPLPHRSSRTTSQTTLSFYVQQPQPGSSAVAPHSVGALIFHRWLTEGPDNTSRVVGKAQGFIIPVEGFAHSAFNIIYLTFHTRDYAGSVSIEAKKLAFKEEEELSVVGGTGSFAFATGNAVFAQIGRQASNVEASYHIKLNLDFPDNFERRKF
ncbi:dirigent protein 11-like [Salvia splendens]|uniref:dirigent protein 11-like n=1 Tax=Salvia splendens TaxID=180675 RepID=UPI001C25E6A6|nr:dirigent protein 11-like [Salvia splendens]